MKTVIDKIDIKCASGLCEHTIHNYNLISWFVVIAIATIVFKYTHEYNKNKN